MSSFERASNMSALGAADPHQSAALLKNFNLGKGDMKMLILSRFTGQSIMIADNIEITVLSVIDGRVRLGITAPAEIPVHRHEIWTRIQEEKNQEQSNESN